MEEPDNARFPSIGPPSKIPTDGKADCCGALLIMRPHRFHYAERGYKTPATSGEDPRVIVPI
jgi:hypothetical protein